MVQEKMECLLCGKDRTKILSPKNHFQISKCKNCGLIFTNNVPEEDEILERYSKGEIIENLIMEKVSANGDIIFPEWKIKESNMIWGEINSHVKTGKILDVGCLWGLFLSLAQNDDWDCIGIEPYEKAALYAQEKFGLKIFQENTKKANFPAEYFDVVTMLDVLEHVVNPIDELREINRIMKSSGLLCVSTPNFGGIYFSSQKFYRKLNRSKWDYLNPPFHFYGFNKKNIKKLLEEAGFKVFKINTSSSSEMHEDRKNLKKKFTLKSMIGRAISKGGEVLNMGDRMICYAFKENKS